MMRRFEETAAKMTHSSRLTQVAYACHICRSCVCGLLALKMVRPHCSDPVQPAVVHEHMKNPGKSLGACSCVLHIYCSPRSVLLLASLLSPATQKHCQKGPSCVCRTYDMVLCDHVYA